MPIVDRDEASTSVSQSPVDSRHPHHPDSIFFLAQTTNITTELRLALDSLMTSLALFLSP